MKNTNINALLEELDNRTNNTIIEELDETESDRPKLWSGTVCAHLISIDKDEYGYHLVFADSNNNPMPSQYDGKFGDIWGGKTADSLRDILRNFKLALHMNSTLNNVGIVAELEKPHNIVFYINGTMGKNGMLYRNRVDFGTTAQL